MKPDKIEAIKELRDFHKSKMEYPIMMLKSYGYGELSEHALASYRLEKEIHLYAYKAYEKCLKILEE